MGEESEESSSQPPKLRRSTRQAAKNSKPQGIGENEAVVGSSDDSDFEDPRQTKVGSPSRKLLSKTGLVQKAEERRVLQRREVVEGFTLLRKIFTPLLVENHKLKPRLEDHGRRR